MIDRCIPRLSSMREVTIEEFVAKEGIWADVDGVQMRAVMLAEFIRRGPRLIERIMRNDQHPYPVLLDANMGDIPATITAAVRNLARMGVAAVTVLPYAVEAAEAGRVDLAPLVLTREQVRYVVEQPWSG